MTCLQVQSCCTKPEILKASVVVFVFSTQPPPAITDKQLDEREHTVEEWKGRNGDPLLSDEQPHTLSRLCNL